RPIAAARRAGAPEAARPLHRSQSAARGARSRGGRDRRGGPDCVGGRAHNCGGVPRDGPRCGRGNLASNSTSHSERDDMNSTLRTFLVWISLIAVVGLIYEFSSSFNSAQDEISFTEFLSRVRNAKVESVTITGNEIVGTPQNADATTRAFRTYAPPAYTGWANE